MACCRALPDMTLPLIYNWRNLFVRKSSTLLTFGVVALIVVVLVWALSFAQGLRDSLQSGGGADTLIIIKPGSTGESTSFLSLQEQQQLSQLTGVAKSKKGEPLCSGEILTQTNLVRRGDPLKQTSMIAVRGVSELAFEVHDAIRIVEGRRFEFGANEVIVGKSILDRVEGVQVGSDIVMGFRGGRAFRVVGVFEASGGPLESEIWCSISPVRDMFNRSSMVSSVAAKLERADLAQGLIDLVRDPPYALQAKTEAQYYRDIAERSAQLLYMTLILVAFMAFGACFAVANTIYASVDGRAKEIAMLRTIGYSPASIVWSFLLEAGLICGTACVFGAVCLGVAMPSLFFGGQKEDFLSDATWSTFAYQVRVTPAILAWSFGAALMVGFIGAIVPAVRASKLSILSALRQA